MDKARIAYFLRSHYPSSFGIRRNLQKLKVKRLFLHNLPSDVISKCEKDPSCMPDIIAPYLKKNKKYLRYSVKEMEDILENGFKYRNRSDKDHLRTDMLFCRLAYGFLPSEYVCFELENKNPEKRKEYVSDTDMNYFGYSVNDIKDIQFILDKADCYKKFSKYFKRDAIIIQKSSDYLSFCEFVDKHSIFVKKEVFSCMGKGVEKVNILEKGDIKEYFKKIISCDKYLLEELIKQHSEMAKYNESSVNTIRCISMKTDRGIEIPWTFMRTGRNGSFVDNGGSGGLVIGVDASTGIINTPGYDEYNNVFISHPDSGIIFMGNKVPNWDNLLNICRDAHSEIEGMGYLSFDMAYTDKGWVIVEVNEVGQFIGPQMTMKKGIRKELYSYMDRMIKYTNLNV